MYMFMTNGAYSGLFYVTWPVRRVQWPKRWMARRWSAGNESVMSGLPGPVMGALPPGALGGGEDAALFFICPVLMRTWHRQQKEGRETEWRVVFSLCTSVCVFLYVCIMSCNTAFKVWQVCVCARVYLFGELKRCRHCSVRLIKVQTRMQIGKCLIEIHICAFL